DIDILLATVMNDHSIDPVNDQIMLVGFSQGTMIALDTLLRSHYNIVGVIGFSGRLIEKPTATTQTSAEVLLIHGESDEIVPA
ncbi:alpha/beta hydrolase, partial [Rosenbergiella nectarea]|uniref:alpha/beta hydrolase n=1 Tax=Rosenbergiella nectarea TaxID=988801 RepID=UPI001F4FD03C